MAGCYKILLNIFYGFNGKMPRLPNRIKLYSEVFFDTLTA